MTDRTTDPNARIKTIPSSGWLRTKAGAGAESAPVEATMVGIAGDLLDDVTWRQFVAEQLATQTLSQQRTEWYARSMRLHVMLAFWLSVAGGVAAVLLFLAA